MKKIGWFLLGVALALVMGSATSGYIYLQAVAVPKCPWKVLGTITAIQAYPAVGERDYNDVTVDIPDANSVFWLDVPDRANNIELRFEGTLDANTATVSILVAADDYLSESATYDDFMLAASVALTVGKQVGAHSNFYVDTAVVTNGILTLTAYDSAADRVVIVRGSLCGYRKIAIIATALDTETLWIQARWY